MTLTATPHPKEVKRESQSPLYTPVSRTHSDLSPDVELHTHRITPYHVCPEGQESKCQVDVSQRKLKGLAKTNLENMEKPWSSTSELKSGCAGQFLAELLCLLRHTDERQ